MRMDTAPASADTRAAPRLRHSVTAVIAQYIHELGSSPQRAMSFGNRPEGDSPGHWTSGAPLATR
jgi:hypothetical protein